MITRVGWIRERSLAVTTQFCLQDSLPLTEVESAFNTSVESIGDRDCKIQRVSALKGLVSSQKKQQQIIGMFVYSFDYQGKG